MKRFTRITLALLVGALCLMPFAHAQTGNDGNVIRITLSEEPSASDESAKVFMSLSGDGDIKIEGVEQAYSALATSYTATSKDIVIRGAVKKLSCSYCQNIDVIDCTASTSIETLEVKSSSTKEIKVAGVKSLKTLECGLSKTESLDLSGCENLTTLLASGIMKLKEITLTNCKSLTTVELQNCSLKSLDLTGLSKLTTLSVQRNDISTLTLSGLSSLKSIDCSNMALTSLDLSGCPMLETLSGSGNPKLETVKLPIGGKLQSISLPGCSLSQIEIRDYPDLKEFFLERNKLTDIKFANCPALRKIGLHLNKLSAEATTALALALPDCIAEYDNLGAVLFALGSGSQTEENKWTAKAASVARAKGWTLQNKDENTYQVMPAFSYSKVTISAGVNGTVALQGFADADLKYLPNEFEYTIVATPKKGYKLAKVMVNGDDVTKDMSFKLFENTEIKAEFVSVGGGKPTEYKFFLTKVQPSVANNQLKIYTYGYDADKRWISRTATDFNGAVSEHHFIKYNAKGQISDIDITTAFDKDGKPSMFAHYTYNDKGQIVSRKMDMFGTPMANSDIYYRSDDQPDYWVDRKAGVMTEYTYNDKGQLIEESFGGAKDIEKKRPDIDTSGKTLYSYDAQGRLISSKTTSRVENWLYIAEEQYTWDADGALAAIKANNFRYDEGETDREKGTVVPVFEMKYRYAGDKDTQVFWPRLPFTEQNGGLHEFSYLLDKNCSKAEYWGLSSGTPKHAMDFIYTFEATPQHLQELVQQDDVQVTYGAGMLSVVGAALQSIHIYDCSGNEVRRYTTETCQRIDMGVSELPVGSYIVQIMTPTGVSVKKVYFN